MPSERGDDVRVPTLSAIALGSNLGDRSAHIHAAFEAIARLPLTSLLSRSDIVETAPVGPHPQGPYLNAAAAILTLLTPRDLLARLLDIERARGRDRAVEQRWGPRTLDLDLLLYGDLKLSEPGLTLPHPRLHERLFVLEPLARILPSSVVPGRGRVADLLARARRD
jgi:2-amino-4-hydroxy-6-hydroxymethyldihydropteridine diphosphokinase